MKKILIALGFTFAAMSSQAALTFTPVGSTVFTNGENNVTGQAAGVQYAFGTLSADAGDIVTFTNLASFTEAGYTNVFINGVDIFSNKTGDGNTFTFSPSDSSPIQFSFVDQNGITFSNGSASIGVVAGSDYANLSAFQFVLLLDDSATGLTDFDDHAVGVSAVPVPAALPLMASALGAFGIARRRNKAKTA